MDSYHQEITLIKRILKENPKGMTVTDISRKIKINRNSVAKYLDIMRISGHVEMITFGPAKVFFPSRRIPVTDMLDYTSDYILIFDNNFKIMLRRFHDLITTLLESFCRGDRIAIVTVHERWAWFSLELMKEIRQNLEVSELERNNPDSEVDVVDQYFRNAPEVFTEKSYDEFTTNITLDMIKKGELKLIINTPTGKESHTDMKIIRNSAVLHGVPCITTIQGAQAAVNGIEVVMKGELGVCSIQQYLGTNKVFCNKS